MNDDLMDAKLRLRAIAQLARMIADDDSMVSVDESAAPEIRDIVRMAEGESPRTNAGRRAWDVAVGEV